MFVSAGSRVGRGVYDQRAPFSTKIKRIISDESLTASTWTTAIWDTLVSDDTKCSWNPNTPKIITPPPGAVYVQISVAAGFQTNLTTATATAICRNGTDNILNAIRMDLRGAGFEGNQTYVTDYVDIAPGDFFYLMVLITSTFNVNNNFSGVQFPFVGSSMEFDWYFQ